MTLLVNEIHMLEGFKRTMLIAAADRRITKGDRTYHDTQPKLFEIKYLKGAVSFFGLAEFRRGSEKYRMSEILPTFIRKNSDIADLQTFSYALRDEMTRVVPAELLKDQSLGFHICGYGRTSLPDYWWLTNIRAMDGPLVTKMKSTFKNPGSNFLGRDAARWGWDGSDLMSVRSGGYQLYRNGDFLVHAVTVELVDELFERLWDLPEFDRPRTPLEFKNYIQYKFKLIAGLQRRWQRKPTVSGNVDVMMWEANDGKVIKV